MSVKSTFKEKTKHLLAVNSFINAAVYTNLSKKTLADMRLLCEEAKYDDSIKDISWLRELRKDVEQGKRGFYTTDCNFSNSHIYGIWDSIFGQFGVDPIYTPSVEHGLILHDQIFNDIEDTARAACVTFGQFRKEIIKKHIKKPVFCVGPYIHYASSFYDSERIESERKKNGKTLLVFPMHSTNNSELSVEIDNYISYLKGKEKAFDTILINTFWWNINDPLTHALESEGYRIVSAGFRDDVMFIRRLKTLIKMSDMVVGDSIGTHVGYCINCGIPFRYEPLGSREVLKTEKENKDLDFRKKRIESIANAFNNSEHITDEQIRICDYYWGNNQVKTYSELKRIVEFTKKVLAMSRGFSYSFEKTAEELLKLEEYKNDEVIRDAVVG